MIIRHYLLFTTMIADDNADCFPPRHLLAFMRRLRYISALLCFAAIAPFCYAAICYAPLPLRRLRHYASHYATLR